MAEIAPNAKRRLEMLDNEEIVANRFFDLPKELKDKILKKVFEVRLYKKRITERKRVLKSVLYTLKLGTHRWYEFVKRDIPDALLNALRGLEKVDFKNMEPLSDFFEVMNNLRVVVRNGVHILPPQLARLYDTQMDFLRITFDGHLRGDPDFYFDEVGLYHMLDDDIYFLNIEAEQEE